MGFGRTFGIGFAVFIGLNFGLNFILKFIFGYSSFPYLLTSQLFKFFSLLVDSIVIAPYDALINLPLINSYGSVLMAKVIYVIYMIVPSLLTCILVSKMGEDKKESFGSWFLIAMVSTGIYIVLSILGNFAWPLLDSIILNLIAGACNGLFYGIITIKIVYGKSHSSVSDDGLTKAAKKARKKYS